MTTEKTGQRSRRGRARLGLLTDSRATALRGVLIGVLAGILAAPGCNRGGPEAHLETVQARRGPFEVYVVEDGELRALNQTTIAAKESGRIEWLRSEGEAVKKGDVLVEMEKKELEEQYELRMTELKDAEASLQELQESLETEKKDLEDEAAGLETAVKVAELRLKMVMDRPTEAERQKTEADMKSAKLTKQQAEAEYARNKQLWETGAVSKNDLERSGCGARIADATHRRRELSYKTLLDGATELEKDKAKLDQELATLNYELARARLESQLARLAEDIKRAQLRLEASESRVRRLTIQLENCTLRAPHDGVVIYYQRPSFHSASRFMGSSEKRKVDIGTRVWLGAGLIELPDESQMKVRTQVSEANVRYVSVGTKATVRAEMLPGAEFHGQIIWIDTAGHDKNSRLDSTTLRREGRSGINVFDVEIAMDEKDPRLKLGFKARVRIPIKRFEDVVSVPKKAVTVEAGVASVRVVERGKPARRTVKLGDENDESVIITAGLQGGESVALGG